MKINNDLYRTVVLTVLAGIAVITVALANREVYSKEVIDLKFDNVEMRQLSIEDDVQWLVRTMGGTPSAETEEDNHTSQPD